MTQLIDSRRDVVFVLNKQIGMVEDELIGEFNRKFITLIVSEA